MSDVRAKILLDRLYAELPRLDCQQKCHSSCGPIAMTRVEWLRIVKRVGYEPRASGIMCPLLTKRNTCGVYTIRPMICRLWGIIESMPCPWGCVPEPRHLTVREGYDFLLRADLISDPDKEEEIEALRENLDEHGDLVALSGMLMMKPRIE